MAKNTEEKPRDVTFTDAPAEYDYTGFGAREEEIVGKTRQGRPVRKVSTVAGFYTENQRMRYGSGCHFAATQERWDEIKDHILVEEKPPTRKIFVQVEPMGRGFQAMADDDHRLWGRADTVAGAIGALLETHAEEFGIGIIHDASCTQQAQRIAEELVRIRKDQKW
jgi:hypothetical protein